MRLRASACVRCVACVCARWLRFLRECSLKATACGNSAKLTGEALRVALRRVVRRLRRALRCACALALRVALRCVRLRRASYTRRAVCGFQCASALRRSALPPCVALRRRPSSELMTTLYANSGQNPLFGLRPIFDAAFGLWAIVLQTVYALQHQRHLGQNRGGAVATVRENTIFSENPQPKRKIQREKRRAVSLVAVRERKIHSVIARLGGL